VCAEASTIGCVTASINRRDSTSSFGKFSWRGEKEKEKEKSAGGAYYGTAIKQCKFFIYLDKKKFYVVLVFI